ncbi:MAG: hypothetical protein FWH31_04340 [Streptococcaceae bacterium]|nr:hypothetical protein [Streptococcaceae bacterium]
MNSRIYLQPDAVPTQDDIRTANRIFRHFGKEVTFLQRQDVDFPDITMNRLRWAISNFTNGEEETVLSKEIAKSPNVIIDFSNFDGDEGDSVRLFQELFEANEEIANLVLVKKSEQVEEFAKKNQNKARRKK